MTALARYLTTDNAHGPKVPAGHSVCVATEHNLDRRAASTCLQFAKLFGNLIVRWAIELIKVRRDSNSLRPDGLRKGALEDPSRRFR